jgi:peptidoglycan/xylan/chitin deacetylase (PgdA/CDA1 family)
MQNNEVHWSCWKESLLSTYYYASLPYRRLRAMRDARNGKTPISVLFYHRVADEKPNPWTCPTRVFARQMRWLKQHVDMISLEEARRRIASGHNSRPSVAITFDDGYAENCSNALPLLIAENIPCTYFVSTRHVLEQAPFAHDVARGAPLAVNTLAQLREMAAAGIEIGAHTRAHVDLGQITNHAQLYDEVVTAGDELREAVGSPVRYFAFPYGLHKNLNADAFHIAREAGYLGVCSAYGAYNLPGDDPFHLRRIHGDPQTLRLKNWVTVDPRKRHVADFDCSTTANTFELTSTV